MRASCFYIVSCSFICGVFADSFFSIPIASASCLFVIAVSLCFYARRRAAMLLILIASAAFSAGALRLGVLGFHERALDAYVGQSVSLKGKICSEPRRKDFALDVCFKPDRSPDRIRASIPLYPGFGYGDRISVSGVIQLPEKFETYPGGPLFDYPSYLAKDGVRYVMKRASAKSLGANDANPFIAALFSVKRRFMDAIGDSMPEPYSTLIGGILLGEKSALSEETAVAFRRAGLTHILVLSGSNVSVVASTLAALFGNAFASIGVVAFALMTGGGATTVRASVMALIAIGLGRWGRRYDAARALIVAAIAMLLENPLILAFDLSFQLSFAATLALILVSPLIKERLAFLPERFGLREVVATSLATQIFTAPLILCAMGEISVVSLVPNVLVLPFVPWAMLLGFLVGALGMAAPMLAHPIALLADLLLWYVVMVVEAIGSLPFAAARISIGPWTLFSMYVLYGFALVRLRAKRAILSP